MHFKTLVLSSVAVTALYFGESLAADNGRPRPNHGGRHPGHPDGHPGGPGPRGSRPPPGEMPPMPEKLVVAADVPVLCLDQCSPFLKGAYQPCFQPYTDLLTKKMKAGLLEEKEPDQEILDSAKQSYDCVCNAKHQVKAANCYKCIKEEGTDHFDMYLNTCKVKPADLLKHAEKEEKPVEAGDTKPAAQEEKKKGNNANRLALGMTGLTAFAYLLL